MARRSNTLNRIRKVEVISSASQAPTAGASDTHSTFADICAERTLWAFSAIMSTDPSATPCRDRPVHRVRGLTEAEAMRTALFHRLLPSGLAMSDAVMQYALPTSMAFSCPSPRFNVAATTWCQHCSNRVTNYTVSKPPSTSCPRSPGSPRDQDGGGR